MRTMIGWAVLATLAGNAAAVEVTVKNDSLVNFSTGVVQAGFVAGERAASWLTSPCNGNLIAAQIFWASQSGVSGKVIGGSIDIHRAGTFPVPGAVAQQIFGPQLTDGVINEYRYLDKAGTIPLVVPVTQDEVFILSFVFAETLGENGPSVVNDTDGIQPSRNAIYADLGATSAWFGSSTLGVNGDWVIRAIVECPVVPTAADVSTLISTTPAAYTAGAPLVYTITIANAGPAASANTTVVDAFPAALSGVTWSCAPSAGATCVAGGTGTIAQAVSLPSGGSVVYTVNSTVVAGTTGVISNTMTAVVGAPANDPNATNNTATANTSPAVADLIFANGFEVTP